MKKVCKNPDLLFYCNYDINWFNKQPGIDPFYKEIITAWYWLQKLAPTKQLQDQYIFYNKELKFKNHPFYWENLLQAGILEVKDLFDDAGNVMKFEFLKQRGVLDFVKWYGVITVVKELNKTQIMKSQVYGTKRLKFWYKGEEYDIDKTNSRLIYCCIRDSIIGSQVVKPKCAIHFQEDFDYTDIYKRPFGLFKDTMSKIFQYKFLNNLLVNNFWLKKWGIKDNDQCSFCHNSETQFHLFVRCAIVQNL